MIYVEGSWRCGYKNKGMWRACQRKVGAKGDRCYAHKGK